MGLRGVDMEGVGTGQVLTDTVVEKESVLFGAVSKSNSSYSLTQKSTVSGAITKFLYS